MMYILEKGVLYMYMLVIAVMLLVMGLMLIISPKSGIKKGTEVTDAVLKQSRIRGIVLAALGAVAFILWLI